MKILSLFSLVVFASGLLFADTIDSFNVVVKGMGTLSLVSDAGNEVKLSVTFPGYGHYKGGIQNDEHEYLAYADRVYREKNHLKMPPYTPISNCVYMVSSKELNLNCEYFMLPYFHSSYGLYSHEDVVQNLSKWLNMYTLAPDREIEFRFEKNPVNGRLATYIDGSLSTLSKEPMSIVGLGESNSIEVVSAKMSKVRDVVGMYELPPLALPARSHELLQSGAKISVPVGETEVDGVPMDVWSPERSLNQAVHHRTSSRRSLCSDPQYDRTPWKTGYEYMQWRIPARTWSHAYILCADIEADGCVKIVGTQLEKLGQGCTGGNVCRMKATLDGAKEVGTLTYIKDGEEIMTPLWLVRQEYDFGKLGARAQGTNTLDFEVIGGGQSAISSLQIFGITLVEAPFNYEVNNYVRGNIWEPQDRHVTRIDISANHNNVRGAVRYEVFDPYFKTIKKDVVPFEIAKRGDVYPFELDFSGYDVGWYGLNYEFLDADGKVVTSHEAAFTVLAADTREAGYESPYAAWPHSGGYHGSNPDPMGPREVMRKAGYRSSWEPPCASEEEGAPWKITKNTAGYRYCQPDKPSKSRASFEERLRKAVEGIRADFEAFPHCQVIQLLHEQGGREISKEVAGEKMPERGEYRGWIFEDENPDLSKEERGDWEVFFCTEYAKVLRKEFPGKKIMIGNGSSSCEKIASLVRRGFDLDLIDQLGIESKGFQTMPEFCANQESPGMLWALRETGRIFGYTNFTLNACNEYVFRTERTVSRDWSKRKIMSVTDFTIRDYLISMAHGCTIISTGHLEDAADAYYDTNWGAGGQCKAYPYSYPKRMFTALAVLTRVIDCPQFLRRVETGENTAIVFEFLRKRKVEDYAYALWTPTHESILALSFPEDTSVTYYDIFGAEKPYDGKPLTIGSSPCYLVASKPLISAKVVGYGEDVVPEGARIIFAPNAENLEPLDEQISDKRGYWGIPNARNGRFAVHTIDDAKFGKVIELDHIPDNSRVPAVVWEGQNFALKEPIKLRLSELSGFGMWVRGNGSYGKVKLLLSKSGSKSFYEVECGERGYITFDGWHFVTVDLAEWTPACGWLNNTDEVVLEKIQIGTTRQSLDPIEMAPTLGSVAIGPIYALPKTGITEITVEMQESRRAWENTPDKDR